jgi:hypothetical protein
MGTLPQAPKIIFEGQMKRINEKISFATYKMHFFFLLFEPLLLSNLITLLFHIHFK